MNIFSLEVRYQKVIMRARFDANKEEKDIRKAQLLLADGCRQLWEKRHFKPFRFALDPGGSSYDRERESPDVFPYYFNKREQRKKELLAHWSKIEKAWDDELASIQTELPKPKATVQK
uniref:NADH dehydrogenase [ubiquinone] 1 beta subcomplex subunit 9 n=1 Tax=Parascaris equorum TaxID=6256 RepID=A0A914RUA5_PAREQ